jgi:glutamate N-acetyltransferase/amino-acid N-acetyltransferase
MTQNISPLCRVSGFRAVGVTCGLKKSGNPDIALVISNTPCVAAAVFTKNVFKAAPVMYDAALLERTSHLHGVIINAGNANAVTGAQGLVDAARMAQLTEEACGLPVDSIFVMSTGVIGEPLAMDKVALGVQLAVHSIATEAGRRGDNASQAIMTTDLVPKEAFAQVDIGGATISLGGMAKGSGMIHINMGTMLSVIATDAAISPAALTAALRQAVARTFNRVTVDGDTSTNDTLLILASGQAGNPPIELNSPEFTAFTAALTQLSTHLARAIARDGEGATKLVEITVSGAVSETEAEQAAKTVATSPLVKTAIFGSDPNWGRILAAIGRAEVHVDPALVSLRLGHFLLLENGEPQPFDAIAANHWLASVTEIQVMVDLGVGSAQATVWTCDLSYKYVEINAEYHT